jgi:hypothetical protein
MTNAKDNPTDPGGRALDANDVAHYPKASRSWGY